MGFGRNEENALREIRQLERALEQRSALLGWR
ncbi:hypothetical protein J2X83_000813 [Brevibacillus nitrificans]|nr:hypothetical protein [Brevibacillus nitrificans]